MSYGDCQAETETKIGWSSSCSYCFETKITIFHLLHDTCPVIFIFYFFYLDQINNVWGGSKTSPLLLLWLSCTDKQTQFTFHMFPLLYLHLWNLKKKVIRSLTKEHPCPASSLQVAGEQQCLLLHLIHDVISFLGLVKLEQMSNSNLITKYS